MNRAALISKKHTWVARFFFTPEKSNPFRRMPPNEFAGADAEAMRKPD